MVKRLVEPSESEVVQAVVGVIVPHPKAYGYQEAYTKVFRSMAMKPPHHYDNYTPHHTHSYSK